jgi:hypothetical protein
MVETEVVKAKSQEKEWRPMRKEGDEASLKLFGYKEFKKEENVSEIPKETHGKYFHSLTSKIFGKNKPESFQPLKASQTFQYF